MNPGGSIKDRIGFHMVEKAEQKGLLKPGGTIIEATAGNTGMGLAMAAAVGGYKLITLMTTKMSTEKVSLLKALGAEVVICPYEVEYGHPEHFLTRARELTNIIPDAWYANQFTNTDNIEAHYLTTGPEIWEQTFGKVDVVIAGMGTGGSLTGIGRYLKEKKTSIEIILADPAGSILKDLKDDRPTQAKPYRIEGVGGDFLPNNVDLEIVDRAIRIQDSKAIEMAIRAFKVEGIFIGASSGLILEATREYLTHSENQHKNIVILLPDSGRSYISTIYNPEWRKVYNLIITNDGA